MINSALDLDRALGELLKPFFFEECSDDTLNHVQAVLNDFHRRNGLKCPPLIASFINLTDGLTTIMVSHDTYRDRLYRYILAGDKEGCWARGLYH